MSKKIKDNDFIFKKFSLWLETAKKEYQKKGIENYNAFCLSTAINNLPSSRMVLLKSFSEEGFIFYTNTESRKGNEIKTNSNVSMLFYWSFLKRQIRVEGTVSEINKEASDEYFFSREYLSKIGAWASSQSREMSYPMELVNNVLKYSLKYRHNVPRPDYWRGLIIKPLRIEFWVEKQSRLHVRKLYEKQQDKWQEKTLFP